MIRILLLLLPLVLFACAGDPSNTETAAPAPASRTTTVAPPAAPPVFPDREWATTTPQAARIDPARLDSALFYLASHCKNDGLTETLLVRNGRVFWRGDSTRQVHDIWSCTKSFTATLAGLLAEEGKLDLDAPAATYEPLLRAQYPDVTSRHFLTMTSGYDAVGTSRWGEASEDWSPTPFRPAAPLFAPGAAYAYWDEAMIMFGRVLTQTAGTSLENYAAEKVMSPLGIRNWTWWSEEALPDGTPLNFGGTGLKMSAEDHARLGLLYLNDGMWGARRVLPAGWVDRATRVQVPTELPVADTDRRTTDGTGIYGYNWWVINAADGISPVDAYYTSGLNHNVCLVVPAWDLVLVRAGTDGNPEIGKHRLYSELLRRLAPGVG